MDLVNSKDSYALTLFSFEEDPNRQESWRLDAELPGLWGC